MMVVEGLRRELLDLKIASWGPVDIARHCAVDGQGIREVVNAEILRLFRLGASLATICRYLHVSAFRAAAVTAAATRDPGWPARADRLRVDLGRHQAAVTEQVRARLAAARPLAAGVPGVGDVVLLRIGHRTVFVAITRLTPTRPGRAWLHGSTPGESTPWVRRHAKLASLRPAPLRRAHWAAGTPRHK